MKDIPAVSFKLDGQCYANWPFITAEWRDERVVAWLKRNQPELLEKLPESIKRVPQYDDRENIAMAELFNDRGLVLVSYIEGNRNPDHNGWVMRYFAGLNYNCPQHVALVRWIREISLGNLQLNNE